RQGEIQAVHSRETERAGHRLNVMAAIFLPLTAVSSVFGMDLHSGLENSPPWMFWLILAGSFTVGLLVSEVLVAVKLRGRK
ncbi:MAG: CorA family divalent cation transporter, partial [Fuerstiella sp.]